MRILQLGKFYPIKGGVEKVEYDLTTGLSEHGVDCDMLCATVKGKGNSEKRGRHGRVIFCRTWKEIAGTMIAPSMITTLRRICRKYDIIHVHHPDPMACMALFFSGYKGKVVLHWHSDIVRQKELLTLYRPFQKWLIRRADLIVGTTPIYIKESNDLQDVQDKTDYLPIGVDEIPMDMDGAQRLREKYHGHKIIFSLGRLVPYKGYSNLIKAAALLPDNYVVIIGGTGPLREELDRIIDTLKLRDKVKLIGFVKDEEIAAYYTACDLFCLPSVQKTEAFGIVQIEAMSLGKPVVATKIPGSGTAWVNEHGISGLNVTPQKPEEIAEAIQIITKDSDVYEVYAAGARERYENLFTKDKMVEGCLRIYERLTRNEERRTPTL